MRATKSYCKLKSEFKALCVRQNHFSIIMILKSANLLLASPKIFRFYHAYNDRNLNCIKIIDKRYIFLTAVGKFVEFLEFVSVVNCFCQFRIHIHCEMSVIYLMGKLSIMILSSL